jgi:hypothetical protein
VEREEIETEITGDDVKVISLPSLSSNPLRLGKRGLSSQSAEIKKGVCLDIDGDEL